MSIHLNKIPCAPFFYEPSSSAYKISAEQLHNSAQTEFRTHVRKPHEERIHGLAQKLFTPWRLSLRLLARVVEPLPGTNKDSKWIGRAIRISSLIGFLGLILPSAAIALVLALPLHAYSHKQRPVISYIHTPRLRESEQKEATPFSIRTHNVAIVHDFMSVMNDLRDVKARAAEIGDWIQSTPQQPDVLCFQETFHDDGTKVLCEHLKTTYPYIIHSVAPHGSGFNSGLMIASKYPIEQVTFRRFTKASGEERLATKGLLGVRLKIRENAYVDVYNTHLQGLLENKRAQIRAHQLRDIVRWIKEDQEEVGKIAKSVNTLLVGDLNISPITAWGEISDIDNPSFEIIQKEFVDLFAQEHDEIGIRTSGTRLFPDTLAEPTASWYTGPHAKKPLFIRLKQWRNSRPQRHPGITLEDPVRWGTADWRNYQTANTCRFDYILSLKEQAAKMTGTAEIRRIAPQENAQSASSDHLALDAVIQLPQD